MANEISAAFRRAWRKFVVDGVPSSEENEPDKLEIFAAGDVVQQQFDGLSMSVASQLGGISAEVDAVRSLASMATQWKDKVVAASTANVVLASGLENGDVLDGVTLVTGNRILLLAQTAAAENGIWIVAATGAPTRAGDADSGPELLGMACFVNAGAVNGGRAYVCVTTGTITPGTTALTYREISNQELINANIAGFTTEAGRPILRNGYEGITTPSVTAPQVDDLAWLEAQTDSFGNVISGTRKKSGLFDAYSASAYPDILHVVCMSQSLGIGYQALPVISTGNNAWGGLSFTGGTYGQLTWLDDGNAQKPGSRFDELLVIGAMTDVLSSFASGETIANGLAAGVKARVAGPFSPFPHEQTKPQIFFSNACTGDRFLSEIGPEDSATNPANAGARGNGGNYKTTVDDMRRVYGYCNDYSLRYSLVTVFMQGEQEAGLRKLYAWETTPYTYPNLVSGYRDKLKTAADSLDNDFSYITGRRRRAPFVTYQTADTVIGEAQLQAVEQGTLMFMASPIYYLPNAKNSVIGSGGAQTYGASVHIAADAERLLGEQFAKVIHRIVAEGENWQPLKRRSVRKIDNTTIELTLDVPRGALVVDTDFLAKAEGWGFEVWSGLTPDDRIAGTATRIVPNSIEIKGNVVRLGLPSSIGAGDWYLRYAGANFCDLGATLTVATVRDGPNTANGFATKELVLTTDRSAALAPLVREGAFNLWQGATRMTVRTVYQEGAAPGVTVLRGEAREIDNGPMIAGVVTPTRWVGYGNIRDSDRALAVNSWSAQPYHQRTGRYPLWNWLAAFDNLRII